MAYLDYDGLAHYDELIKNKIDGKQDTLVSGASIKTVNGTSLLGSGDITTPTYTLPTATASTLGGVKVGSGLVIDANGVLSLGLNDVDEVSF